MIESYGPTSASVLPVPHCAMFIRLEWWCDAGDETMSDQRFRRYERFRFSTSFWVRSPSWWHRICICICGFCICFCGGGPFLLTWSKIFVVKMRQYWAVCLYKLLRMVLVLWWKWWFYRWDWDNDLLVRLHELEISTFVTKTTHDQMFFVGSFTLDLGIGL